MKIETYKDFISRKEKQFLEELKNKKIIWFKDISRKGRVGFLREGWTFLQQHNLEQKVFLIERLKFIQTEGEHTHKKAKIGDIECRFCYFIVGKNGIKKNKWTWGQYCPFIPPEDLKELLDKAKEEKTII